MTDVSIVIPALNEAHNLPATFDAIERLDRLGKVLEVILVDNGSTDETAALAEQRGARVLEAPGLNVGALRNLGARHATGTVLAFLDADCLVDRAWLRAALPHMENPTVGATGCHTRIPEDATWVERTHDFHGTTEGTTDIAFLPTANLLVRREVFERIGGFDPELQTGEDSDLSDRIRAAGLRLVSDTRIRVIHLEYSKTLPQLYRKEIWHAAELWRFLVSTGFRRDYVLAVAAPAAFGLALAGSFALLLRGIWTGDLPLAALAFALAALVPIGVALRKAIMKRNIRFLALSTVYYAVVLLARIAAGLQRIHLHRADPDLTDRSTG